jgi:hypothetical protein
VRYSLPEETGDPHTLQTEKQQVGTGLQQLFGAATHITWEQVDGFARGPSGKFQWIICELQPAPRLSPALRGDL